MRRYILIILLVISIFFINVVPCFAYPWSATQADIVTNSVQSIDTKVGNLYTGIQSIYQLLYNSGNTITQGVQYTYNRIVNYIEPKLDTVNYYLGRLDYNSGIIMQKIIDYFGPISGDNKTIAQQLYDLRQLTAGVGNQVADVSSKLITTNSNLTTINNSILTSNQSILNKLNDIYSTFYYNVEPVVYNFENYLNNTTQPRLNNYPYSGSNQTLSYGTCRYFNPVFTPTQNLLYTIIYPMPEGCPTDGYTLNTTNNNFDLYYANDIATLTSSNASVLKTTNISHIPYTLVFDSSTNSIIVTYDFSYYTELQGKYFATAFLAVKRSQTTLTFDSLTPYSVISEGEQGLYFAKYKEQYDTIIELLSNIDNNSNFIYNDDDVRIDVELSVDDSTGVTNVISKIKSLYNTGIDISAFIIALNQFDNLDWFTLSTYNVVNKAPGSPIIDLYD